MYQQLGKVRACMKTVLLKEKETTVRIVPMGIASVPVVMRMLLVLTNGMRFMCTKSPTVSTYMETRPRALPSHTFSFFPLCWLTAALFCLLAIK